MSNSTATLHEQGALFTEEERGSDRHQNRVERFAYDSSRDVLVRRVRTRNRGEIDSTVDATRVRPEPDSDLAAAYDAAWLRLRDRPYPDAPDDKVRVVDLFSGCGGMTLGVVEAARALNLECEPTLAVDVNEVALDVYASNFPLARVQADRVEEVVGETPGAELSERERQLRSATGEVDVLVGGPPCQGHSNLNNHSRRTDPKNELFLTMARAAEVLRPEHVIIENVRDIVHDRHDVFRRTRQYLENSLGYRTSAGKLEGETLGVPQKRHRMFIVASRSRTLTLGEVQQKYRLPKRDFSWACSDLNGDCGPRGFDTTSEPKGITKKRIDWLHDEGEWELKNELRPPCHRDEDHTYLSVYGRIRPNEPAPTITTGFPYMGQGRFVHPHERRTLTPHEAARLQFFPDFFKFGDRSRSAYQTLIGNAVPSKLCYVVALELLR